VNIINRLTEVLDDNIAALRLLMAVYEEFSFFLTCDAEAFVEEFASRSPSLQQYQQQLQLFEQKMEQISLCSYNQVACDLFSVDCSVAKESLIARVRHINELLMSKVE